mgnify:CR=1 FL=1
MTLRRQEIDLEHNDIDLETHDIDLKQNDIDLETHEIDLEKHDFRTCLMEDGISFIRNVNGNELLQNVNKLHIRHTRREI